MEIFFSVGEPSGDQHGAQLVRELQHRHPQLRCTGFGGPQMRAAGCELLYPLTNLAVMGIARVLPLLGRFYELLKQAERYFEKHRPDAVVLVDFPGFNWHIARKAKAAGIPVFYYLPPQLWAWAPWRIGRIRKYVDHVLCGLPFEKEWYAQRGVEVEYVGHPFFDEVLQQPLEESFCRQWRDDAATTVAVLPGSRTHEVTMNWPSMLKVIQNLHRRHGNVRFLVANYRDEHRTWCEEHLKREDVSLPVHFFVGKTSEIIETADCALMVSGSVSLEMMARRTPAVVIYRASRSFYFLVRLLVRCRYMSLPNLIVDRPVLPEFFSVWRPEQDVQQITELLSRWLASPQELKQVRDELDQLCRQHVITGATAKTAAAILDRLPQQLPARQAAA